MTEVDHSVDFNVLDRGTYLSHRRDLIQAFIDVRAHTESIIAPFSPEDMQLQSMPEASPSKWHLAHGSWFFETFILEPHQPDFAWFDEKFRYLFNSYYNKVGAQYPRAERGLMSRPGLERVLAYRQAITDQVVTLLDQCSDEQFTVLAAPLVLGLNHEQQHQELMWTDINHALFRKGLTRHPGWSGPGQEEPGPDSKPGEGWVDFDECRSITGFQGSGFCFDNELAAHESVLPAFHIAARQVNNTDWLEFMADGGYANPLLWLADGWAWKCANDIEAPLYWFKPEGFWRRFTLDCVEEPGPHDPVRHISYYEADAFASWCNARLPREAEWEHFARSRDWTGSRTKPKIPGDLDADVGYHLGSNWEWTQSAYSAYPGFRVTPGMAAEYNGKFMVNQMVLRGASVATSGYHSRPSYRNFFYPDARWQFTGLRLARDPDSG